MTSTRYVQPGTARIIFDPGPTKGRLKIWKSKLLTPNHGSLPTTLSQTLEAALTSKEKACEPFLSSRFTDSYKSLWLPTKIDLQGSASNLSSPLSPSTRGKSWFSIERKSKLPNKSSARTSSQSLQFSLPEYTVSEVAGTRLRNMELKVAKKGKSKNGLVKTLKIRIFPDSKQRDWIEQIHTQYRWFYNAALDIAHGDCNNFLKEGTCSETKFRDLVKTYRYEEVKEDLPAGGYCLIKQLVQDPEWSGWPVPANQTLIHNRVARGAAISLARALNSGLANLKAGNIKRFQLSYKSKKRDSTYSSMFEDASFPKEFLRIPGKWCYRNQAKQRTYVDWKDIFNDEAIIKSGFVLEYDCLRKKHYILYTVPVNWYPEDCLGSENQAFEGSSKGARTISLDPGVRTFLTGYDPNGHITVFGDDAADRLWMLLLQYDRLRSKLKETPHEPGLRRKLWQNVRKRQDLCRELHWKCASFLVSNYDLILLPHFRTAQMLRGRTISKRTKRLLQAFQFYQFKERLAFQCRKHGKCLIFVEEHYTSKTCGRCGKINWELGGNKTFNCTGCGLCSDRDENAARNILLKQLPLLVAEGMLPSNPISLDS